MSTLGRRAPSARGSVFGKKEPVTQRAATIGSVETAVASEAVVAHVAVSGEEDSGDLAALGLLPDPADLLTDRARGWKAFIGSLSDNFDRVADAEKALAKAHAANLKVSLIPLRMIWLIACYV